MPRIVPAELSSIQDAARSLRADGVVAFPTETVYGLGACTFSERGLDRVYVLKGRPADNPLIAHVLDAAMVRELIADAAWDSRCETLAGRFWPGPLTLVLRKSRRVPGRATAGRPTVAVRAPAHPVARALLEATGVPVSAPSANRSGRVSPTSAEHVRAEFADVPDARDLVILDGGVCEVGIESTVLDMTTPVPQILRHGSVTAELLLACIGAIHSPDVRSQGASPGTSEAHYAPRTPMDLAARQCIPAKLRLHADAGQRCVVLAPDAAGVNSPHAAIVMPEDAPRYAQELYARLREADAMGADRIIVERPHHESQTWRAILDRLERAAAGHATPR